MKKNYQFPAIALLASVTALFTGFARADGGGSHSGDAYNPFTDSAQVSTDAVKFSVASIKTVKVPTSSTTMGQYCNPGDEYAENCAQTSYGNYVPAYRVTVDYQSNNTQLVSDEYPDGSSWSEDFVFPTSALNPALVAQAQSASGNAKKAALQSLFAKIMTTPVYGNRVNWTKLCEYNLEGETEWVKVNPSCQDEYTAGLTAAPVGLAIQLVPAAM